MTAAELLQYFLSRYRADDGAAETRAGRPDGSPVAEPRAVAGSEDDAPTSD